MYISAFPASILECGIIVLRYIFTLLQIQLSALKNHNALKCVAMGGVKCGLACVSKRELFYLAGNLSLNTTVVLYRLRLSAIHALCLIVLHV